MSNATDVESSLPLVVQLLLQKRQLEQKHLDTIRQAQSKENLPLEEILVAFLRDGNGTNQQETDHV